MSSVANALALGQMQVAIYKKQLESVEQQGRQALSLIQAAAPPSGPPANAGAAVGTQLNVVA